MYQCLLVEDDSIQRAALHKVLEAFPGQRICVVSVSDYSAAVQAIQLQHFDLFILDVLFSGKSSDKDGIALGRYIRSHKAHLYTPILYVTAVPERIGQALSETNCCYYILKPYTNDEIYAALDRVLLSPLVKPPELHFHTYGDHRVKLSQGDILVISKSSFHSTLIHTESQTFETPEFTLTELESRLSYDFIRVHKSFIVNMAHVSDYNKTDRVLFIQDREIPVGRRYKMDLDAAWRSK